MAKDRRLCINCLQAAHKVKNCRSTKSCLFCNAHYKTMLHFPSDKPNTTGARSAQDKVPLDTPSNEDITLSDLSSFIKDLQPSAVMLSTAVDYVQDGCGNCGPRRNPSIPPNGLSHTPLKRAKYVSSCIITPSRRKEPCLHIRALVFPQIISHIPSTFIKRYAWEHTR
ncbi:hypothetical protein PR048_022683 [Dryococelus australis]|uniref:Uncharacterized protein n=1 Tax=Dryococelus australis TaxID=614101 RepID=A0ABQ9GS28_9NEOP|nr:hypothetical protein PR048_022683 [Dryococelus australis]